MTPFFITIYFFFIANFSKANFAVIMLHLYT